MNKFLYSIFLLLLTVASLSQETLNLEQAVLQCLDNNYNIKIIENNLNVAKNNTSVLNSGYLPMVNASTGIGLKSGTSTTSFRDSISFTSDPGNTTSFNSGVSVSFTIFDGMYRSFNYTKLKEQYALTELETRQLIENTLWKLYNAYYTVASLTEKTQNLKQSLEISAKRLQRFKYNAEYGQGTQLDILNAQVDNYNDSINLLNSLQQLENSKRDMNLLLGREISIDFTIDTLINYYWNIPVDSLLNLSQENNVAVKKARKNILLSELNTKIAKTNLLPSLNLVGNYYFNSTGYDENSIYEMQRIVGPSIELSLSWTIFDGGRSMVNIKNSKIAEYNSEIEMVQSLQFLERDVLNAWNNYQNALYILEVESANLLTNTRNFHRTEEQYNLGQLSSIEFRQAQLNLLNAQLRHNSAKYSAKLNEIQLYQLAGLLMEMPY